MYDINLHKIKNMFSYSNYILRQSTYFQNIDFINIKNSKFILLGLKDNYKIKKQVKVFINYIKNNQQISKIIPENLYKLEFYCFNNKVFNDNINSIFKDIENTSENNANYNCVVLTFNENILDYCENNKDIFSIFIEYNIILLDKQHKESFISLIQLNTTYQKCKIANENLKNLFSDFDYLLEKENNIFINLGVQNNFNHNIRRFNNLSFPQINIKEY